jgi:hypothetical protein
MFLICSLTKVIVAVEATMISVVTAAVEITPGGLMTPVTMPGEVVMIGTLTL